MLKGIPENTKKVDVTSKVTKAKEGSEPNEDDKPRVIRITSLNDTKQSWLHWDPVSKTFSPIRVINKHGDSISTSAPKPVPDSEADNDSVITENLVDEAGVPQTDIQLKFIYLLLSTKLTQLLLIHLNQCSCLPRRKLVFAQFVATLIWNMNYLSIYSRMIRKCSWNACIVLKDLAPNLILKNMWLSAHIAIKNDVTKKGL